MLNIPGLPENEVIEEKPKKASPKPGGLHSDAYKPPYKTINGYKGFEVMSALQKCVRRGLEKEALFWASEWAASCDHIGCEHLWHRLRVVASEDVGLADNDAAVQVSALYANFTRTVARYGVTSVKHGWLFIVHAVLLLARAPKSRITDHACMVIRNDVKNGKNLLPMPDFAKDNHAGGEANWDESFKLANCTLEDVYEHEARKICEEKYEAEQKGGK
jgi:replication-associated recombination protein RarA